MAQIDTVYLISHVHTDIGYTDHQNVLFRQHMDFIDQAIDLCEATADYPPEAQYKWTCEIASTVEHYFQTRPSKQIDRFLNLNQEGRLAVAAMAYHWTPMLSPVGMVRSLYPANRLRRDYGVQISSAMQCDVDGLSWLWADLLPAIGITGLTMSVNPYRGARPKPELTAFWWEGPGGNRILTFNGPHYGYAIFQYGIGNLVRAEELLPGVLDRLKARDDYPYDFLYGQVTHPALPDNGPPYEVLSDFVRTWNESGRLPRMIITTVDGFLEMLHSRYCDQAPVWRGDWVDWWADGVASTAYETAVNRTTEALLPAVDYLCTQVDDFDAGLVEEAYRNTSLYDEHTWGAYNSITQPHAPFTRAQWNRKASFAFDGYALTHELLARNGRKFARRITGQIPEGDAWRQRRGIDYPGEEERHRFLVINSLSWTRMLHSPPPPEGGGGAPYNFLDAHFIKNYRDSYPIGFDLASDRYAEDNVLLLDPSLPPFGYKVVAPMSLEPSSHTYPGQCSLENHWYRIQVDPITGGLTSWYDKELRRGLAGTHGPWKLGQYLYEWVDDPRGREAIFKSNLFLDSYGIQQKDTPFRRQGPTAVQLSPAINTAAGVSLEVHLKVPGAHSVRVRYFLPHHEKALHIDMVIDKNHVTDPESIYILFPFDLDEPVFHLDLNGVPLEPERDQLPGTCRDWYSIQRWAEVGNEEISIVMAALDSPLVQVGGIQTGRWAERLDCREATLVSWPVQNHWPTNFRASQSGELLFRYRLTSSSGYHPAAASRFAAEHMVPPIIIRVPGASLAMAGQFMSVDPEGVADVQIKRAEDGQGLIVRGFNLTAEPQHLTLTFLKANPTAAWNCSPVEENGEELPISNASFALGIPSRSIACARVIFQDN